MKTARILLLAVAALIATTVGVRAGDPVVTIENFTFKPAAITVHAGMKVTFKNADDIPHSVVASDGSFHSKALDTDETATFTIEKAGDYAYFCGLHPHMQGKIVVVP